MLVKGIVFPESRMAQPMELPLYPRGPRGGEALVAQGLHRSSNRGEPGLGELLPSDPPPGDFLLLAFRDLGFLSASSTLQGSIFSGCCR